MNIDDVLAAFALAKDQQLYVTFFNKDGELRINSTRCGRPTKSLLMGDPDFDDEFGDRPVILIVLPGDYGIDFAVDSMEEEDGVLTLRGPKGRVEFRTGA